MASAEKLLQDAQYAFHNIGHGSSDARKHTFTAKRLSQRILRKYPGSAEALLAQSMLDHLTVNAQTSVSKLLKPPRTLAEVHVHDAVPAKRTADKDSWYALWQRVIRLPYMKKRILFFLLAFGVIFIVFTPFLLLALVFYVTKPAMVKKHITQLLDMLHPETHR